MLAAQDVCVIEAPDEDRRTPGERLIADARALSLIQLVFAQKAAAFAATNEFEDDGAATAIDWIRIHCHMTGP
jgi:hypothetical protein